MAGHQPYHSDVSVAHLVIQGLSIWGVSDQGREAVQADSAPIQLCHPFLPDRIQPATGAALQGAIAAVSWTPFALPKGMVLIRNGVALHQPNHHKGCSKPNSNARELYVLLEALCFEC